MQYSLEEVTSHTEGSIYESPIVPSSPGIAKALTPPSCSMSNACTSW